MKNNNLLIIVGGIIAFIIINEILPYGTPFIVNIVILVLIVYSCYRLITKSSTTTYGAASTNRPNPFSATPGFSNPKSPSGNSGFIKFLVIAFIIFIIVAQKFLASLAYYLFSVGDNLNFTYNGNPLIIWAVFGVLLGAVYGGIITYKKFRLKVKYALMPAGFSIFIFALLFINNSYFKSHIYEGYPVATDSLKTDSTRILLPQVTKRKKLRTKRKHLADTSLATSGVNTITPVDSARTDTNKH